MLEQARIVTIPRMKRHQLIGAGEREIEFLRGDARHLVGNSKSGFTSFAKGTFDCVTVMFGIGGIDDPIISLKEQLAVLKEGGILSLVDIHQPLYQLDEKMPFYVRTSHSSVFRLIAWEKIAKPLVLGTLWGWRDPTPIFYFLPFITLFDSSDDRFYGFRQCSFSFCNEPWWFHLPVMSTARIVVEKIEISPEEFKRRSCILRCLSTGVNV